MTEPGEAGQLRSQAIDHAVLTTPGHPLEGDQVVTKKTFSAAGRYYPRLRPLPHEQALLDRSAEPASPGIRGVVAGERAR